MVSSRTTTRAPNRPAPIEARYIPEPLLVFGGGGKHVDPKEGIARFGPYSASDVGRHPRQIRVGIVGSAETISETREWMQAAALGVPGEGPHLSFPGFQPDRGFFADMSFSEHWDQHITQTELATISKLGGQARFEAIVLLVDEKVELLAQSDQPPTYVVLALPKRLLLSKSVTFEDPGLGWVQRDLRRALKARTMRHHLVTQILLSDTPRLDRTPGQDHPAAIAWDFFTGMYYKGGGLPWAPVGLPPQTCFIGVSFYRALGSKRTNMQTSLVQAFDQHGEGLILRGHEFEWDPQREESRSPHLNAEMAAALVDLALDHYERAMNLRPRRVVIHKTSRFLSDEETGFKEALRKRTDLFDLVAVHPSSDARLFPESKYPPLRGTSFRVDDLDYLYTTGFIPELADFPYGRHVPVPLFLADHIGQDTSRDALLREVLILTKLNWNSTRLGGLLPITVRFSRQVGDILKELPDGHNPLPQAKFYM